MLSLQNLHDIVVPTAPGWWPFAAGLWVAIVIVALALLFVGYRFYRNWKRNSYRRAGLLLLPDVATEYEVSVVLKRVALAAYPREQVASLFGAEWVAFLQQTCSRSTFKDDFAREQNRAVSPELMAAAAAWIKHHSGEPANRGTT